MNFLLSATGLVEAGFSVFPLHPMLKIPAVPKRDGGRGCLDATQDLSIIRQWARRFPNANVGIGAGAASGIIVIDLDPKHGSAETVAALKAAGKHFGQTVCARTARGGWHLYFQHVPGISNSVGKLGGGLDVRSDAGYVVAPPSVTADGAYRWAVAPGEVPYAPLPAWVVEALTPKPRRVFVNSSRARRSRTDHLFGFVATAPEGRRNALLFWAACRIGELGQLDSAAHAQLINAAQSSGLDRTEAEKTVQSACRTISNRRVA